MSEDRQTYPVEDVLDYLERMAENKLDSERKREESIIQQASNMQSAFAFSTAALFMVATIVYANRGAFSHGYFFCVFASITVCLLASLFSATMAQNRMETVVFPDIREFYNYIDTHWADFETKAQRVKYYVERCADAQESLANNNNTRVKRLRYSKQAFYISIAMCIIWTIITKIILFTVGGI